MKKFQALRFMFQDSKNGFTLLEILISLGIFLLILGATTPFTFQFYRRYQLDSDRSTLIGLLRQARTLSLNGQGGIDHGVYIASSQFTLFDGASYAARTVANDYTVDHFEAVAIAGPSELVFRSLSGKTASVSFTLDNLAKKSKIYVNTEGRIDWE